MFITAICVLFLVCYCYPKKANVHLNCLSGWWISFIFARYVVKRNGHKGLSLNHEGKKTLRCPASLKEGRARLNRIVVNFLSVGTVFRMFFAPFQRLQSLPFKTFYFVYAFVDKTEHRCYNIGACNQSC